ncbi:hypothetical protein AB0M43_37480 [Longispora sp. NPDC051575]|uniref:hypothetical protein n=1 Tax=Longispora sp. NPDC051575 TaxID=3154943 RepID=UPI00343D2CE2
MPRHSRDDEDLPALELDAMGQDQRTGLGRLVGIAVHPGGDRPVFDDWLPVGRSTLVAVGRGWIVHVPLVEGVRPMGWLWAGDALTSRLPVYGGGHFDLEVGQRYALDYDGQRCALRLIEPSPREVR